MAEESEAQAEGSSADAELESVQSAARWLVGAAASVFAALLAGLQLSALTSLTFDSPLQLIGSLLASLVALVGVGVILVLASKVLIHPGWTITKLSRLETQSKWNTHWLRNVLQSQAGLLAAGTELRPSLLHRRQVRLSEAWFQLHERGATTVSDDAAAAAAPTRNYRVDVAEDVERLGQRLNNITAVTTRVTTAANLAEVRRRYKRLVRALKWAGFLPVLAILYLAWAAAQNSDVKITEPVEVSVLFTDDRAVLVAAGLPDTCLGKTVEGIGIGGSLQSPIVVSREPTCTLRQVQIEPALGLVIPAVKK